MAMETIPTPLTRLLNIRHPIMLAGMNVIAGANLAAAVTNSGGLGVIGGVGYTPDVLRKQIDLLKKKLKDPNGSFGVDLLLPQVGGNARRTNVDYTGGTLPELIDIIISSGAKLFVSAVGVPPRWAVEKLHAANILVMNMVGSPKHVSKALEIGVDLICAQGGEGGGHTGDVASTVLWPMVIDMCKGRTSPLTGEPVYVVAAGGIYDGRGLATALCYGAQAVWVGTRFVCAKEAGAPPRHQKAVIGAGPHDTVRTIIYTGRPMRILKNEYVSNWEDNKQDEIKKLTSQGIIPAKDDFEKRTAKGEEFDETTIAATQPLLMGQVAAAIKDVLPAETIMNNMVREAITILKELNGRVTLAKL